MTIKYGNFNAKLAVTCKGNISKLVKNLEKLSSIIELSFSKFLRSFEMSVYRSSLA